MCPNPLFFQLIAQLWNAQFTTDPAAKTTLDKHECDLNIYIWLGDVYLFHISKMLEFKSLKLIAKQQVGIKIDFLSIHP